MFTYQMFTYLSDVYISDVIIVSTNIILPSYGSHESSVIKFNSRHKPKVIALYVTICSTNINNSL